MVKEHQNTSENKSGFYTQKKNRMIVLFIPSRSYCNGLGLDFTENNHSLSKLTLG